jgi:DNA invertase Pin-like site-specific DNA recombinase
VSEENAMSKLLISIMGAFTEFERALIRERQRDGIALAKRRGVYKGRKPSLTTERTAELRKRALAREKKAGLAREFGISRETLYQYTRERNRPIIVIPSIRVKPYQWIIDHVCIFVSFLRMG